MENLQLYLESPALRYIHGTEFISVAAATVVIHVWLQGLSEVKLPLP